MYIHEDVKYIHIYIQIHIYIYIHTYVYKCTFLYIYICKCIYIYIHTKIHMWMQAYADVFARYEFFLLVLAGRVSWVYEG